MPTSQKRQPAGRTPNGPSTSDNAGNQADPTVAAVPEEPKTQPQPQKQAAPQQKPGGETLRLTDLKDLSIQKLTQIAKDKNVVGATGMRKQDLIFQDPEGADRAERVHLL